MVFEFIRECFPTTISIIWKNRFQIFCKIFVATRWSALHRLLYFLPNMIGRNGLVFATVVYALEFHQNQKLVLHELGGGIFDLNCQNKLTKKKRKQKQKRKSSPPPTFFMYVNVILAISIYMYLIRNWRSLRVCYLPAGKWLLSPFLHHVCLCVRQEKKSGPIGLIVQLLFSVSYYKKVLLKWKNDQNFDLKRKSNWNENLCLLV